MIDCWEHGKSGPVLGKLFTTATEASAWAFGQQPQPAQVRLVNTDSAGGTRRKRKTRKKRSALSHVPVTAQLTVSGRVGQSCYAYAPLSATSSSSHTPFRSGGAPRAFYAVIPTTAPVRSSERQQTTPRRGASQSFPAGHGPNVTALSGMTGGGAKFCLNPPPHLAG
jgi:hypothetical protein